MVSTWTLWLFVLGVAVGAIVTAVALVRLPRRDDDISAAERPTEAAWISEVIERNGGVAPSLLVEEVLELHGAYLRQARPPVPPDVGAGPAWAYPPNPPGGVRPGHMPAGYVAPAYASPGPPPPPGPPLPPGAVPPGAVPPGAVPLPGVPPPNPPTRR